MCVNTHVRRRSGAVNVERTCGAGKALAKVARVPVVGHGVSVDTRLGVGCASVWVIVSFGASGGEVGDLHDGMMCVRMTIMPLSRRR